MPPCAAAAADYQEFARRVLGAAPGVWCYTTEIVVDVPKWTTELPLEDQALASGFRPGKEGAAFRHLCD
ncbi:MAG: hypothetical protein ACREFU_00810 [Acetobacteraceae bacterium]